MEGSAAAARISRRMHWSAWCCLAATLVACGGSPASPDPVTSIVTLGAQVLRITPTLPACRVFPLYTRVTVSRSGNGWLASASNAGDVHVRFQPSKAMVIPGTLPVEGTITGTAVHMPELLNVPTGDLRANFGSGGGTVLEGFAFSAGAVNMTTAGLDGVGTGSVTVADANGVSCTVTRFSWSIFPPQ